MLTPDSLSLFIPAMMLLVILPEPDFALVSRLALLEGKRAGQLAACGVALGIMLPQIMTQNEPPAPQLLEMGIITALLCLAWYLFLAQALGKIRHFFTKSAFRIWLQRLTGIAFLFFGFRLF